MQNKKLFWCTVGLMAIALLLTSCSGTPQVKGVLVRKDGQAFSGQVVLWKATGETTAEGGVELEMAYKTQCDDSGAFRFEEVEPGSYAVSYLSSMGEMDFLKTDAGGPHLVEVTEGQGADLGEIQVGP
jgi:hypothetical protein